MAGKLINGTPFLPLLAGLAGLFLFSCALPPLTLGEAPASSPQQDARQELVHRHILDIVKKMPSGGGYSTGGDASSRLTDVAIVWDDSRQKLKVTPTLATPSFCSGACYLVLLQLLQRCPEGSFSPEVWLALDAARGQKDGHGVWGRANANGPGFAKLIHDLGAGINFHDPALARPGDFLKIFWTREIGGRERGHLVVYLGRVTTPDGKQALKFWSSNQGAGYSAKTVPLEKMKCLIFTRITNMKAFKNIPRLEECDPWLESLLTKPTTLNEVRKKCGIR